MSQYSVEDAIVRKELFLDDRFVDEMSGLTRSFHEPVKCPENPVIRADRPWERDAAFVDTGLVIYDEKEALFKAWYQGGGCHGPGDKSHMCYATSADGVHWDKPSLGEVEFEGSKDNNIVLLADCMMHDPAPIIDYKDPDPQRRFKAVWWGGKRDASAKDGWLLGHCVGFSPDGIHWTEHPDNPVWVGDAEVATPFGIERREGKFVMYNSADGYGMRVTARCESEDFVHWEVPPKVVFQSDQQDPAGTEIPGLSAVDYDGTLLGMLWVSRNLPGFSREEWQEIVDRNIRQGFLGPPIAMNAARCRIVHTELVVSVDNVEWKRINRELLIPFGPEGSWDECVVIAARPIVVNDRIYLYYAGIGRRMQTPGVEKPQPTRQWTVDTGLATLRLDGFASLDAGTGEGTLVTKPLSLDGTDLCVNVDAGDGQIVVEILDAAGEPIEGFSREEAQPITGDQLRAAVSWTGRSGLRDLLGRHVKFRLFMTNAHIYSISILSRRKD
ncbi:MAG: hypothetical protein KAV87_18255 [Desulfobacteraceae bacterium]|nr:hypothetical protein [Desulfobacteraceae bacterium]